MLETVHCNSTLLFLKSVGIGLLTLSCELHGAKNADCHTMCTQLKVI
jgi:hypothetical protein